MKPNSEAMQKKRISYIDNPNEFNNAKQNLSLNELINVNYSLIENPISVKNKEKNHYNEDTVNEDSNFNVSPAFKHLTDNEIKDMGSIDLIGVSNEKENDNSFRNNRNCEHGFLSKIYLKTSFFI